MRITREIKAIVLNAIDAVGLQAGVVNRWGIDEREWRHRLLRHMQRREPVAHAAVEASAAEDWYERQIAERIRKSRDQAIENLQDWDKQLERLRAGAADEIMKIRIGQNEYLTKRLRDCTTAECLACGEQYLEQSRDLARRGRFLLEVGRQMRLAGLSEDDTLRRLLVA